MVQLHAPEAYARVLGGSGENHAGLIHALKPIRSRRDPCVLQADRRQVSDDGLAAH